MPTLLKYIKETKYNSQMFLIEQLANEHIGSLYIKEYQDRDWAFLANEKIKTNLDMLEKNKIYNVEIKEIQRNGKIKRTYHLKKVD